MVTRGQPGGLPPCLIYYLRTTPSERLLTTVCLRQPAPLRELSTLNVAAAWRLAQCWRPALVAARVLLVRSPDAQFCPQIPLGKVRAPKNVSAARAGRNGASRRRRLFRGEAREKRRLASAKGASWRARTAAFVSFRPWLRSGELWPEACTCVRCPCAHPFTHPFAGCMAGREGSDKARGLNADGPAVAALPSWGSPCRRTHPQPSHHVAGVWAVRVGVCSVLDLL